MKKLLTLLTLASLSTASFAGPTCVSADTKDQWMDQDAFQAQVAAEGYDIKKFKVTSGNCYETYAYNAEGQKVETYYNPITGEVVKREID